MNALGFIKTPASWYYYFQFKGGKNRHREIDHKVAGPHRLPEKLPRRQKANECTAAVYKNFTASEEATVSGSDTARHPYWLERAYATVILSLLKASFQDVLFLFKWLFHGLPVEKAGSLCFLQPFPIQEVSYTAKVRPDDLPLDRS